MQEDFQALGKSKSKSFFSHVTIFRTPEENDLFSSALPV